MEKGCGSSVCSRDDILQQIGNLLGTCHEIVHLILSQLTHSELLIAMQVCTTWDKVARIIFDKRKINYITIHPKDWPATFPDNTQITLTKERQPDQMLTNFIRKLSTTNSGIFFCVLNDEWWYKKTFTIENDDKLANKTTLMGLLSHNLSPSTNIIFIRGEGVIGTVQLPKLGPLPQNEPHNSVNDSHSELGPLLQSSGSEISSCPEPNLKSVKQDYCSNIPITQSNFTMLNHYNFFGLDKSNIYKLDKYQTTLDRHFYIYNEESQEPNRTLNQSDRGPRTNTSICDLEKAPLLHSNPGYSIEFEDSQDQHEWHTPKDVLTMLNIPKQRGCKIQVVEIDKSKFESYPESEVTPEQFERYCGLNPDIDLKAFLFIGTTLGEFQESFIKAAVDRQNQRVALGGGLVQMLQNVSAGEKVQTEEASGQRNYEEKCIGICISGDQVRAASVVVPKKVVKIDELKRYMKKLKSYGLEESHSVCFLFACCGRGKELYQSKNKNELPDNVETRIFREHFPHTPVFGFFGEGEVGLDYHGSGPEEGESAPKKRRPKLFHQYSSVFVLISFV